MSGLLGRLLCWAGHHDPRLVKLTGAQIRSRGWRQWEQFWALDCLHCGRRVWTGGTSELVGAWRKKVKEGR